MQLGEFQNYYRHIVFEVWNIPSAKISSKKEIAIYHDKIDSLVTVVKKPLRKAPNTPTLKSAVSYIGRLTILTKPDRSVLGLDDQQWMV